MSKIESAPTTDSITAIYSAIENYFQTNRSFPTLDILRAIFAQQFGQEVGDETILEYLEIMGFYGGEEYDEEDEYYPEDEEGEGDDYEGDEAEDDE